MLRLFGSIIESGVDVSNIKFLRQMWLNPSEVGALVASSKALGDHMAVTAGVRDANLVVEFGGGTGALTRSIVAHSPDPAKVLCFEINDTFVDMLRGEFPDINVYNESAKDVLKHVQEMGHDSVDSIISGLPFAVFDDELQNEILKATYDVLSPRGKFVTFTYCVSPFTQKGRNFKNNLSKHFNSFEKSTMIWRNFPPAFTYCATK